MYEYTNFKKIRLFSRISFYTFFFPGIVFLVQCANKTPNSDSISKIYASLSDTVKYVGMNTCRQCHADIYETFMHTGMGSSFDIASKKKSAAKFGHALVYDKFSDFYYKAFWEGDSLKFLEFRLNGKDTVHKRVETVNYIVGSGQHTNSHIYNTNGYLHQAPMTFYTQKSRWDLPPGFENGGNSRFNRIIGLECMSCHNGYPGFVLGSENKYTNIKNGIDCERCHGPGEKHVKDKMSGKLVDISKEVDYSILNPSKLPVDLQLDVCQRCHIQGNAVLIEGKSFFDFRPGMKLTEVMNVFMPVYAGRPDEHIMASHAERMKMSRCFTETVKAVEKNKMEQELKPYKNAMTCITCHNPHVSVRTTNNDVFNSACKNCHSAEKKNSCTEMHDVLVKANNNCVKCHMVNSSATDIPHVRVTDHYIRKPVKDEEIEKVKKFIGIACINNPSPPDVAKGNAFIAYFEKFNYGAEVLDSAKKYFADDSKENIRKNFHSLVHISFLKKDYSMVVYYEAQVNEVNTLLNKKSFSNTDAWTSYRLGEAFENLNDNKKALKYYQHATELAPYEPGFQNKYGTQLMQAGKPFEAKKVFEFMIKENPKNPSALSNLGFIYLTATGDTARSRELYDKAISLDPDYLQAQYNLAGLYIYRQKNSEARNILTKILKKHPRDEKAKQVLNSLNAL